MRRSGSFSVRRHYENFAMKDDYATFKKYFPRNDDVTLIVLKGHLLIEEYMYQLLSAHFARPSCLKEARLSFSKLKWITQGLCYKPFDKWLWDSIGVVNQIRNAFAHKLEPDGYEGQLDKLFQIMKTKCPINGFFSHARTKDSSELLRRALADILFCLVAMRQIEKDT